jgi:hypothetical protein
MRLTNIFNRVVLSSLFTLGAAIVAQAQVTAITNTTSTPFPGAGHDYIQLLSETVSPANGAVSLRLSIPTPPGRQLPVPFAVGYDSSGVHHVQQVAFAVGPILTWRNSNTTMSVGGWSYSWPQIGWVQSFCMLGQPHPLYRCNFTSAYGFQDTQGTRHSLGR